MHPATVHLHLTLLRLSKGMVAAWEDWLVTVAGVKVPRSGAEWLKAAELVAAAKMITTEFQARQEEHDRRANAS